MVWGMYLPERFGEFWPDGDFEGEMPDGGSGWDERLRLHYMAQPREEQKQLLDYGTPEQGFGAAFYGSYANNKFTNEVCKRWHYDNVLLSPIKSHEAPIFFQTTKSYGAIGSLIKLNDRIVAVDDTLKNIIEQSDHDSHAFFPIEIRMPRGKIFPKGFYTLQIGRYLDSFVPELSKRQTGKANDLTFSSAAIGQVHMWRERTFGASITCCSDELHAAIADAGLRTPKLYAMKEV